MSTVVFYHYTDKASKDNIIRSGTILPSPTGAYGPGVYGTTISPEEGRKKVSKNNWDRGEDWEVFEGQGRADCAFRIFIPAEKVEKVESKRDIYIHDGSIRLSDYTWELLQFHGWWTYITSWCQIL